MMKSPITQREHPSTIGELRDYLDALEANWTAEDDQYLGKFRDQALYVVSPNTPGTMENAYVSHVAELGVMFFPEQ